MWRESVFPPSKFLRPISEQRESLSSMTLKPVIWWNLHARFTAYNTVFLSRFGSFLRSELKFSKLPVQSSHQCVTCAHEKNSFSFIWTRCKCFGTSMHMIMYNSLLFPTLSIAYVMLIKMYCNGLYGIVSPPQHLGISSLHKSLHAKWLNKLS